MKLTTLAHALLIIDMQNGVLHNRDKAIYQKERLIRAINQRIVAYRAAEKPLIFIQHDDPWLAKNSFEWQLVPELDVRAEDYFVSKTHADSFYYTDLAKILSNLVSASSVLSPLDSETFFSSALSGENQRTGEWGNSYGLEVCGAQTEYCVDATVKAAFDRGYTLQMVHHATSTYDNAYMTADATIRFYETIWEDRFVTFIDEKK